MRKLLIILGLLIYTQYSSAQDFERFKLLEDSLYNLGKKMLNSSNDFEKYAANTTFKKTLESALSLHKSYKYSFDSLDMIARLYSEDNKLRIFNWHIAKSDGKYEYFAIVQSYDKKKKIYKTYELIDRSEEIESPEDDLLQKDEWYGAHYYKLIETKYKKKSYYTLLGWDGSDLLTTRKIIEVMRLSSSGRPRFGAFLFRDNKQTKKRVIFEFSSKASVSLKYDKQLIDPSKLFSTQTRTLKKMSPFEKLFKKRRNDRARKKLIGKKRKRDIKKRKRLEEKQANKKNRWKRTKKTKKTNFEGLEPDDVKGEKMNMIIFDRVGPANPALTGLYQFYEPKASAYDAYVFFNGKWRFVEDIEARNWEMPTPAPKQTPVSFELVPSGTNGNK